SRYSHDAVTALLAYEWPGNVRELRNAIFRAVMLAKNAPVEITAADLKLTQVIQPANGKAPLSHDLDQLERQIVFDTLERCGGNQGKAAQALGISRRTLLRKLKTYREAGSEAGGGEWCIERFYRKQISTPIRLKTADEWIDATLLNISLGGAAISIHKLLGQGSLVTISLSIPEGDAHAEITGRIAWANKEGHHGIQFGDLSPEVHAHLQRWFQAEMKKDGWDEEQEVE
ncbi:MAG TPA: PilZ domain-containing protein, partial [Candidatus Angelobacter sp.]|nr:PilZ domain-containing protein [Candidatus Angelobacter sp.]